MANTNPKVITIKELSELLGVSRSTIYDWLNVKSKRYDPTFPQKIKLGGSSVRFSLNDVEAWIESKRV